MNATFVGDCGVGLAAAASADEKDRPGRRARPVELLWYCVTRALPDRGDITVKLDPASCSVQLSGTDYQLARRFLVDLVTNAWKAGAHRIEVAISVEEQPGATSMQITLHVDDGPGMPAEVLDNSATSLAVMAERLRSYSGSLSIHPAG